MGETIYPLHEDEHIVHPKGANRKKECPYCKKQKTLLYDDINGNYIIIKHKRLYIQDDDDEFVSTEINFCPICGNSL